MGLTKARKLVERDQVHMMAGALLSSTGYALAPYIDSQEIPMVYPVVVRRRPDAAPAQQSGSSAPGTPAVSRIIRSASTPTTR